MKPKCHHQNPIPLRLAHILEMYEITYNERISHFICLMAQNAVLTYKLFSPQRTGLQLRKRWQLLPRGRVKWDAREAGRAGKE